MTSQSIDLDCLRWAKYLNFINAPIEELVEQSIDFPVEDYFEGKYASARSWTHWVTLPLEPRRILTATRVNRESWADSTATRLKRVFVETTDPMWTGVIEHPEIWGDMVFSHGRNFVPKHPDFMTAYKDGAPRYVEIVRKVFDYQPVVLGKKVKRSQLLLLPPTSKHYIKVRDGNEVYAVGYEHDPESSVKRLKNWYPESASEIAAIDRLSKQRDAKKAFTDEDVVACCQTLGIDPFNPDFYTGRFALSMFGLPWMWEYDYDLEEKKAQFTALQTNRHMPAVSAVRPYLEGLPESEGGIEPEDPKLWFSPEDQRHYEIDFDTFRQEDFKIGEPNIKIGMSASAFAASPLAKLGSYIDDNGMWVWRMKFKGIHPARYPQPSWFSTESPYLSRDRIRDSEFEVLFESGKSVCYRAPITPGYDCLYLNAKLPLAKNFTHPNYVNALRECFVGRVVVSPAGDLILADLSIVLTHDHQICYWLPTAFPLDRLLQHYGLQPKDLEGSGRPLAEVVDDLELFLN